MKLKRSLNQSSSSNADYLFSSCISSVNVIIDEHYQQNLYHDDHLHATLLLQCVVLVLNHNSVDKSLFGYILSKCISNQHLNSINVLTINTFVDFIEN